MGLDLSRCYMENVNVSFYINSADSTKNLIAWSISLGDEMGSIANVTVDDETGKLLGIYYFSERVVEGEKIGGEDVISAPVVSPDEWAEIIAGYYGLDASVMATDKNIHGYYSGFVIRLSDGDSWIDVHGGVTEYDIWFNT